ncbi:hypothetical protein [Sorangium sp. So ce131]|uniref:hypothetical protein n=1 Tax=Sorangium sp. So ce131 TaxID=3133282 RepID=UPI003F63941E
MKPASSFSLVAAAVLLAAPRPARGFSDETVALSWVRLPGAEACVGARALAQAVEARLGRAALVPAGRADLTIEARIEPARAGGWRAVIAVADASGALLGRREIATRSPRCKAIEDDLALAIALMIDPEAKLSPGPPPAPVAAAPLPAPLPAERPPEVLVQRVLIPASPPPPQVVVQRILVPPPPPDPLRVDVGVGPAFGLGLLPALGAAAALRARLSPPRLPAFELGALLWAPSEAAVGPSGARFSWAEGFVSVCPLEVGAATRLSACAAVRAGALSAGGFGFDAELSEDRLTVNGALEARAAQRLLGPLTAAGGFALVVPFVRDTFYYTDAEGADRRVFRMAPLGGTVEILLGVEFP